MKRIFYLYLFSVIVLLGTTLPSFGTANPTAGDGKWYYVKSQRGPSTTDRWWTVGGDGFLAAGALQKTDAQMFTLVEASAGKVTFNNKGTGFTMSYDPADSRKHMKFVGITPVTDGWTITSNIVNGIQGWAFPGEVTGLHQSNGPSSPDFYRIMGTWYQLSDNCTFFFYEANADIDLQIAIEAAQIDYNTAIIGVAPGNYPEAAKTALGNAITTAQGVLGSTEPTAINSAISDLNAAVATFQTTKVKLAGATPVVNDGKWYYIKSQRSNTAGFFWTLGATEGDNPIPNPLTKADNQKFTLVTAGSGKVRFKSFDGRETDAAMNFVTTGGTSNGWTLTSQPTVVSGVQGWSFPGENAGLHQGAGSWNWEVRASGWYTITDFCTFFFFEAREDIDLQLKIEEASKIITSAVAGSTPGSTPQSAIDALGSAVSTANATLGSTDVTAINNAVATLNAAITTYNSSKVPFVQSSTEASPKWYLIKNTGRGGIGGTLFVDGFDAQMKITSAANSIPADGSGSGATAPSLAYLFRFEIDTNGKYRIVNALFPDGEMLQASSGGDSSQPIKYGIKTTPSTVWNLTNLGLSNGKYQFNIISDNLTNCHASGAFTLVSWNTGVNEASAWYVEEYTGQVSDLYQAAYNTANSKIEDAKTALPSGTNFFEATTDGLNTLNAAQDRLTAAYNNGVPTPDFNASIAAVDAAIAGYWATLQFPYSTASDPQWCVIQSVGNNANVFDALMSKETETQLLRGILPADVPIDILEPKTLFRFEKDAVSGKVAIINHDGTSITTADYATSFKFADAAAPFFGWDILLEKSNNHTFAFQSGPGASINITNATGANVRYYSSYFAGGIADKGNQFKIYPYEHYFNIPVGNIDAKQSSIRPIVINGSVKVGNNTVEVYTITGLKIENKNLKSGVYIVKSSGHTYKVSIN